MELKEYIKQSYLRPNKQVLESLGASDELIEYLRTTPWNTNWSILEGMCENKSNILFDGEVDVEFDTSVKRVRGIIENLSFGQDLDLKVIWDGYTFEHVVWNEEFNSYFTDVFSIKPILDNNSCEIVSVSNGIHEITIIKN